MAREEVQIGKEVKLIPIWAWALGALAFSGMQVLFHVWVPTQHNPPPLPLRIFLGLLTGIVFFFWFLLLGYVNRDAGRRKMNRALWTLLVIFIPNGIGFILYFLLRHPPMQTCPKCLATVEPGFNYCPKCHYSLTPTCPHCRRPVRPGDVYCAYCGQELAAAPTEQKLAR